MPKRLELKRLRPNEVLVPDRLWLDRDLSETARHLFCLLRAYHRQGVTEFSYRTLCEISGLSHNSLVKAFRELEAKEWVEWRRTGLRTLECKTVRWKGKAIALPTDLLLDRSLPRAAKWVYGVVRRLRDRFSYRHLTQLTGYSRTSLIKYLRLLQEAGWLEGVVERVKRRKEFGLQVANPPAAKREREVEAMRSRISVTARGSSLGQALLIEAVRLLVAPGTEIIVNGRFSFMENPGTGCLLEYDIYLIGSRLALEFQGAQHAGPTERFPSQAQFQAQGARDQLKRELSQQFGVDLAEVWRVHLPIPGTRDLLFRRGVPLRKRLDEVWHLVEHLERTMARYRSDRAA